MAEYHFGSRMDRLASVKSIEDKWNLDTLLDLLGGLWDHAWQVQDAASIRLLELASNPEIEAIELHPKDLAYLYVSPNTYEHTFSIVHKMKEIGLPAKDVCRSFFEKMKNEGREKRRKSLEILEGSPLKQIAESAINEI